MKQQVAVLIGTLLILPGCAQNDNDLSTDSGAETTATGAPATTDRDSASDTIGSGSTFDTSGDNQQTNVNSAATAAGSSVPPASAQGGAQNEAASTNENANAIPPTPANP